MKMIELRRHSIKQTIGNAKLSEEGVALARQVAREDMKNSAYSHGYVSGLERTVETYHAMMEGAPDSLPKNPEIFAPGHSVGASDDAMKLWDGVCYEAEKKGEDKHAYALKHDCALATKIAEDAADAFVLWVNTLPEGAHALVINHSPFLELLALGLTNKMMPQLEPCEGFVLRVENGSTEFVREIRLS